MVGVDSRRREGMPVMRLRVLVATLVAALACSAVAAASAGAAAGARPPAAPSYSAAITQTAGLVGSWPLGARAGPVAGAVARHDGTYTGGFTLGRTGAIAASTDRAAAFNGTTGYVTVPSSSSFDVGDVFTAEAWVRRGAVSTTANQSILSRSNAWLLMINSANQI